MANIKKMFCSAFRFLTNSDYRFLLCATYGFYNGMDDKKYLGKIFKANLGYELLLENPQTFNEKLQWLKLYDRKPIYTTMVDKYAVKQYVADIIGEEYIIPTLGVWDRPEDIDWDSLPNQFVLKVTHDSGGLVICKDKSKLNKAATIKKINKSLKRDYYKLYREWPYKDVPRRVIAEKYMQDDSNAEELTDYKLMCFNGKVKCSFTGTNRHSQNDLCIAFYDSRWSRMPFERKYQAYKSEMLKSQTYEQMVQFAEKLSEEIPFSRINFYELKGKPYFGEITFFPESEFEQFNPSEWDKTLGKWIQLPNLKGYLLINDFSMIWIHEEINEKDDQELTDYKIYTFAGKARLVMINKDRGRNTKADYFDENFQWQDFTWGYPHSDIKPTKPLNFEKMLKLAEQLAENTSELRVDFYEVQGRIYFGEMTFFDGSGFDAFNPIEWDYKLGSWIEIS